MSLSFSNVHRDIERHIEESGGVEKRKDGFLVYHGYDDALEHVVGEYVRQRAYEPLVKYFRTWNWEVGDNDLLLSLTDHLRTESEWTHLARLWDSVINKRRKLYRDLRRIRREDSKAVPAKEIDDAKALLLSSLERLRDLARALGREVEVTSLERKIRRLESKNKE